VHQVGDAGMRHGWQSSLRDWLQRGQRFPPLKRWAIGSYPSGAWLALDPSIFVGILLVFSVEA
jgi:hypothetical protein